MDAGIGTGTNINAGLTEAQRLLQSARAGAKKVVILLSDGEANMYYESNSGRTIYNYYSNPNVGRMIDTPYWFTSGLERGMLNISSLIAPKIDGFYSIKFRYIGSNDSITSLKGYISGYNSGIPNEIFSANNENDLQQKFKEITDKILPLGVHLGVHHVTISDVLSKYVQLLPGDASHLRVVKIKDGNEQELNDNQVTIETKKNEQGLVEVTAKFNPSYTLEDDAKYVLKFTVTSSQEAFDAIAGDKTLTSDDAEEADATKLYSNKGAKVAYSYGIGTSRTKIKDYSEKPTFKPSDPLTVPVEIEWKGVDGKSNPSANRPPSVELNLNQKKDGSIKDSYRKVTSPVQTNSFTENTSFAKVAKGYDYELKAPDAPGYTVEVQKTGTKEKPSFKVIYRQLPSLTVKKILEGEQSPNKSFTINVTLSDKDGKPINGKFGNTTVTNGKAQISLKNSQETALSYLPRDTHYKVEEVENSRTGYHVTYEKQEGTLSEDVQTIVTNHRLPTLSVTKKVTGAFANLLQSFKITINVKDAQNKPLNGSYSAIVNNQKTTLQFTNGKATVDLKKDKTIKILDLPLNARYSIEEEASSSRGYQVSYDKKEGTLDANKSATVTNNKNSVPETGIDFLSSTLVLGVVLPLGGIFFIILLGHLVVNRRK
ncbi:fibronectin-binding protein [Streptococcus pneumoniae]|nr:fibronectin-binding protein [Streptococcus pneumoniae]